MRTNRAEYRDFKTYSSDDCRALGGSVHVIFHNLAMSLVSSSNTVTSSTRSALLGSLITPYGAPATCTNLAGYYGTSVRLGASCAAGIAEDDYLCWPPATSLGVLRGANFYAGGFYSPGIVCPVGYVEACRVVQSTPPTPTSPSIKTSTPLFYTWTPDFPLQLPETAVGCCPG